MKNLIILQGKVKKGVYRLLLVIYNKNSPQYSPSHFAAVKSNFSTIPLSMFSTMNFGFNKTSTYLHIVVKPCINSKCLLSTSVFHQRLGHPNPSMLNHIINSCLFIKAINGNKSFDSCDACKFCILTSGDLPYAFTSRL